MSTVTIATIAVIIFLIIFIIIGWCKGFLRIILTTLSLVATMVIAAFLLTPVSNYLAENTGILIGIEKNVSQGLGWSQKESTTTKEEENRLDFTAVIAALKAAGYDVPDDVTEDELLDIYNSLDDSGAVNEQLKTDIEETVIDQIKLPKIIKNTIFSKQTLSEQIRQGIESFKQYVVERISSVALKIMTYVALVIAIFILVRILLLLTKVLDNIPVVRGINRFFGAVVGFIEASLLLWLLCLIISLIANTEFGGQVLDVIHQSRFLSYIYEENLVLRLVNAFFTLF